MAGVQAGLLRLRPSLDTVLRTVAVSLAVGALAMVVTTAALAPRAGVVVDPPLSWLAAVVVVAFSGLVVAWARPRNTIGWLLLAPAWLQALSLVGAGYAQAAYSAPAGPWPGALFGAWVGEWAWFPSLVLPVAVLPSLYPSGRPASKGWARLAVAGGVGTVLVTTALALSTRLDDVVEGLRLPWDGAPAAVGVTLVGAGFLLLAVAVVGGLAGSVRRTARARSPERQQLVWLLTAVVPVPLFFFLPVRRGLDLAYALLGVAVAIGVLKYRLLGITIVLRRTLLYVPLTALVALVIGGVSTVIARFAPAGQIPVLVAAAVVAVLVGPVTVVLRRWVDHLVLGDRADPLGVVDRAASRSERADGDPVGSLLGVLADTLEVGYAGVVDPEGRTLAEVGDPAVPTTNLPLRHAGDREGELVIGVPRSETDRRIATALSPHLATLLRSRRLNAELSAERDRVLSATLTERDRIRRDLHDGLGPSLSGISLGIQAAARALPDDLHATEAILRRTREEADAAVAEVRRVLGALRPVALDGQTLDSAVRSLARRMGLEEPESRFTLTCGDLVGLPGHVEEAALRITGEALNNVVRHARASRCDVDLRRVAGYLEVRVSDDGEGLSSRPKAGVGLPSMWQRAVEAGGTLVVTSPVSDRGGTLVCAQLPLERGR